ncbi:MAG: IclR family transcriptional regulator [Candidatus Tectomicrobia bacterium]|uniref:IclR family transcriptional regulator n=1 Tax=Tectimicrobiota bacterium TaxID=2528274 RepID=A0A932HZ78_UNCTE|nr:IclR family transcriptional regulator [Candidatus Tectomicrobia bacterium]
MNQSLQKTARILDILMESKAPIGVNEFARLLRMPKSTVSRFMSTMESLGMVRRDPENGRFFLGFRLFELGCKAVEDLGLRKAALPLMESLRDRINESVVLTVLEDTHITYLDIIESHHAIVARTHVGGTAPAYCVSSGKVMLAHHPERIEKVIAQGLRPYTSQTVTDPDRLRRECEKAREQGYALNRGEFREGVNGVGAPIFNAAGAVVGAVSTSTPAARMHKQAWQEHAKAVTETARAISRRLGATVHEGAAAHHLPG